MKKRQIKNFIVIIIVFIFLLILFCIILSIKLSQKRGELTGEVKYCTEDSRNFEVCTQDYNPVCGYFIMQKCTDSSCKKTFSNSCFACIDKNTLFYVDGKCQ